MDYSSFSGAPRFLTRPKAFMVSVGKDATLSCQIVGNPIPLVIWEKDKLPIQSGGRFKMVEDGDLYRLTIYDLSLEDSGQYICRAKNTIGEAFTAVSIKVGEETMVTESAPYFIQKPSSIRVTVGEDVMFKCKVQGSPPISVSWEKDGRHLGGWSDSNHFQIESLGESNALKIHCARLGDSGTYMCRAENPIGSTSATATLVVDTRGSYSSSTSHLDAGYGKTASLLSHLQKRREEIRKMDTSMLAAAEPMAAQAYSATEGLSGIGLSLSLDYERAANLTTKSARNATFGVLTRTFNVTEGKHAKLSCYVTGEPKPEIVWRKDGEVIMEGRRHVVYEDEQENFVLKILFCKQIDNGLYTCTASNLAGQTYSSVLVTVRGNIIKKLPRKTAVPINDTAIFCVELDNECQNIRWLKNMEEVKPNDRISITSSGKQHTLIIRECTMEDAGEIAFLADECRTSTQFTVSSKFSCILSYSKHKNVRLAILGHSNDLSIYSPVSLSDLSEEADYQFRVSAVNSYGQSSYLEFPGTLHLEPVLAVKTPLTAVEAMAGGDATFIVDLTSTCSGTWYLNGKILQSSENYIIQRTKTTHILTIKNVTTNDNGAEVKFVAKTIETKIHVLSESLELSCEVSAVSGAVVWKKDQAEVKQDQRVIVTSQGTDRKLIIKNVTQHDQGSYTYHHSFPTFGVFANKEKVRKEVKAILTESATLSCEVAQAKTEVKWYKDGKLITSSKKFKVESEGKSRHLVVEQVEKKDAGEYICEAAGQRLTFKIIDVFAHKEKVQKEVKAVLTESAMLSCEVAQAKTDVKWYKDGKLITSSKKFKVVSEDKSRRLVVEQVEKKDAGEYTCEAAGQKLTFKIIVSEDVFANKEKVQKEIKAVLMESATLSCEVAQSDTEVKWYKDGKQITSSKKLKVESEGKSRRLVVKQLEQKDAGEYTCEAEGQKLTFKMIITGEREGEGFLMVYHPTVKTLSDLEFTMASPREMATLSCEVAQAKTDVKWYKDGKLITSSKKFKMESEDKSRRLVVEQVERKDAGEYTCEAAGQKLTFKIIKVEKEVKAVLTESATLSCEVAQAQTEVKWYKDGKLITSSKKFKVESEGKSRHLIVERVEKKDAGEYTCEAAGQKLTFRIEAVGDCEVVQAKTEVKWYKDGKLITSSKKFKVESEGKSRHLVVDQVEKKDAGEYSCEAAKLSLTSVEITIEVKAVLTESATLSCEVAQAKTEVKWHKDGKLITPSKKFKVESKGKSRCLVVEQVEKKDAGEYMCEAAGQKLTFKINLEAVSAEIGGTISLTCELSQAKGNVSWYKNGAEIKPSKRFQIHEDGVKRILTIKGLQAEDEGEYSCESRDDKSSVQVTPKGLHNVVSEEGKEATFKCIVSPSNAAVTWHRNGVKIEASQKYVISQDDADHRLTIADLTLEDAAEISANAEGVESKATLTVREAPVLFKKKLEPKVVEERDMVTLEVELSKPSTEVKWMKNNVPLQPGDRVDIKAEETKHSLTIRNVTFADRGFYSCETLQDTTQARLNPLEVCEKGTTTYELELSHEDVEGSWMKDGLKLKPGENCHMSVLGKKHSLTLSSLKLEDSGLISFKAEGIHSSGRLVVRELPVKIVKPLRDKIAIEKHRGFLECQVSRPSAKVKWYRKNTEILPSQKYELLSEGVYRKLIINDAEFEDEDIYTCDAIDDTTSAHFYVEGTGSFSSCTYWRESS
uniref:Ig-like domain-containing protein n=1 Tax=Pelusios castaneus TaxID=367368 RepID=A0A8C8RNK2_9SAUR